MKNLTDFCKTVETGVDSNLMVVLSPNPQPYMLVNTVKPAGLPKLGKLGS